MVRRFGQEHSRHKKTSRYQRQFGGGGGGHSRTDPNSSKTEEELLAQRRAERRRQRQAEGEEIDAAFGYERYDNKSPETQKRGWLFNVLPTTVTAADHHLDGMDTGGGQSPEIAGLDLYFQSSSGARFKSTVLYSPYFYVLPSLANDNNNNDDDDYSLVFESISSTLLRLYEGLGLLRVEQTFRVDLDQPNHLSPKNRRGRWMLKLVFGNVQQLVQVRQRLYDIVQKNQQDRVAWMEGPKDDSVLSSLVDLREYDVPYVVRVCTDLGIRVGAWYTVRPRGGGGGVVLSDQDVETKANPTYLAFDIECTKAPLKFPDARVDCIFMISYMVSGQGYLILSRHVVSQNVPDFEYTPQPGYPGPFHIWNEATEEDLLKRFLAEYQRHGPQIVVTYNGDFFDWPFLEQRAAVYGLDVWKELGVSRQGDEYRGRCSVHLDAFHWVQRDSYLPQGAHGLKAVTKYKLGYDPVEVDPEDMVRFARERPVHMATYSVSDAVATYYLYEKYVHLFIFSLCTIIPMGPEDVLRKGSGTLCETLLMVQACSKSIICPNKQNEPFSKFHQGHLLESETYIGGKVECLETGVFRSDVEYDFDLQPSAFQMLIDNIDRDLSFAIEVEGGLDRTKIVNYNEIRSAIVEQLEMLRDRPKRREKPFIYHLDVGAMYPNIILTNRLQPSAIVDDATCAACDYNQAKNGCKRPLTWIWRGDYSPATRNEYERTKDQLRREAVGDGRAFHDLSDKEQADLVASRLKTYSRNAYRKTKITEEITKTDTVCMRENDFYVDTVRRFRDRRYELKKLTKMWKKKKGQADDPSAKKEAADKALVYDSLQIAHKCILNSFYGYVMRKGARWRSMEMAGIVTKTGADLITQARILVEQIGRPLELDTDGIWCILPKSFPDEYMFKTADGGQLRLEYPCVMLNADVHDNFTNHQYQTLKDPKKGSYEARSECSIFFEVDGPYRCMVLPASTEEGKLLKKRYAVFNFDGSLAELKGFELKRRGELELIKTFQSQVFERFLDGDSLVECYDSVGEVANHWIDVLDTQGESLETDELVDLISENRNMSRQLEDYGDQKGTSQTTARRLGEFLGAEIIKDKGLNCKFIIAEQPYGAPVTERAVPTAIWKAESSVMKHYLRKWLKAPGLDGDELDIRNILDWAYYRDRLGKTIQKIITIPAALQKLDNPVPRVPHPSWLHSKVRQLNDRFQQTSIKSMFNVSAKTAPAAPMDIEDFGNASVAKRPLVHQRRRTKGQSKPAPESPSPDANVRDERVVLSKSSFNVWLEQKKSLWKNGRRQRKRTRMTASRGGLSRSGDVTKARRPASSMEGYVRDAAAALRASEWHVIEVRELSSMDQAASQGQSNGVFVLWVMIGKETLQKVHVTVSRTFYVTARTEIHSSSDEVRVKKVDKRLPHNQSAPLIYEVTMAEHMFRSAKWSGLLRGPDGAGELDVAYETGMPLMLRALTGLGCVVRAGGDNSSGRMFALNELRKVNNPGEGGYLNGDMNYGRTFIYNGINYRSKTGIVAVFFARQELASDKNESLGDEKIQFSASSHFWVVKPGSSRSQKNVSHKQCQRMFSQVLQTICDLAAQAAEAGQSTPYHMVSSASACQVQSLRFVADEKRVCSEVNEILLSNAKSNSGPNFLLVNSSKPIPQLRRSIPGLNSSPVIEMPFPPGPDHNPSSMELPALNWETPALQLAMEAYFYVGAVSFPRRLSFARYGQIPIGNLGTDENVALFDVGICRQLEKSRSVSWASRTPGKPDLGVEIFSSMDDDAIIEVDDGGNNYDPEDILGGPDELLRPVITKPGAYRNICVDIDIHDLAIAALTDGAAGGGLVPGTGDTPGSPQSVADFQTARNQGPLGDSMSTSLTLTLLRVAVNSWLQDAFNANSMVADDMLHHLYRMVSSPNPLLCDPALHRAVHSIMKNTFFRLLGELKRLGCSIVLATFNKVTVATNKTTLADAEEYINFVISTIRKQSVVDVSNGGGGLPRVALRVSRFYQHFLFHDEYNFGGLELQRQITEDSAMEGSEDVMIEVSDEGEATSVVVPSVFSAWEMRNHLGSDIASEYFRAIVARFSRDVFRKQRQIASNGLELESDSLVQYKRKMIGKHFSSYLTRAVDELLHEVQEAEKEGEQDMGNLPLDFVKSVLRVLELDSDVQREVRTLKKNLLNQLRVPEYSTAVEWENPCPAFMLPDVFCSECHDCRDLNLTSTSAVDDDDEHAKARWMCPDCGMPYDLELIEQRLIDTTKRKVIRFQMQDTRCSRTNRTATRVLAKTSQCSAELTTDTKRQDIVTELERLRVIASQHRLDWLEETTLHLLGDLK